MNERKKIDDEGNSYCEMKKIINYLTIDVEDYFQVAAFEKNVKICEWGSFESRVTANTQRVLEVLEKVNTKATFFVVGWIAEQFPLLVEEIAKAGHVIGCHSYLHQKVYTMTPEQFREDTKKAKMILEDISGQPVLGYRAPSYSITNKSLWALDILGELGFTYDSSIFPIYHDAYGIPNAPRFAYRHANGLMEYPISTVKLFGLNVPVAGGGYFRLFPYGLTKFALEKIGKKDGKPFVFYLHPWEIDPTQPRMQNVRLSSKFRHYNNLDKVEARFEKLLRDFSFEPLPMT